MERRVMVMAVEVMAIMAICDDDDADDATYGVTAV